MKKVLSICLMLTVALSLMTGCSAKPKETAKMKNENDPIRIVTMTDTEGGIIGNMMVQALEASGYKVDNKTQSASSTKLLRESIIQKQAHIILDYTGNGMYISGTDTDPVWKDLKGGYEKIKKFDLEKNNLVWLAPPNANNTELLAVKKEFAEKNNIKDMNDLAKFINNGGDIKVSCPAYWLQHNSGLIGLEKAYGFKLPKDKVVISDSRMENMKAVSTSATDVNCTMVFTTDGVLEELGLYVVKDPLSVPPVYAPTGIVQKETLDKYPEIETVLAPVFAALDTETLVKLNAKVQSQGAIPADVAKEFLTEKGILK